jgi:hypothetical protein
MRRFVPTEVAPLDRQVAQQRPHPVCLGAHREGEPLRASHLRCTGLFAGIGSPDQPVQQIEPLGIACLDGQRRQIDQRPRNTEAAGLLLQGIAFLVV